MARVRINSAALTRTIARLSDEAAQRAADRMRARASTNVVASGRVDTGEMAESFVKIKKTKTPLKPTYRVGNTAFPFKFQEPGTRGSQAKPGRVLRFKPKGATAFIFRKSTGPIAPGNFLRNAKRDASPLDFGA